MPTAEAVEAKVTTRDLETREKPLAAQKRITFNPTRLLYALENPPFHRNTNLGEYPGANTFVRMVTLAKTGQAELAVRQWHVTNPSSGAGCTQWGLHTMKIEGDAPTSVACLYEELYDFLSQADKNGSVTLEILPQAPYPAVLSTPDGKHKRTLTPISYSPSPGLSLKTQP